MKSLILALVCTLAAAGCEGVSSANIQKWKNTQKGPGKLHEALKDSSVAPKLRAEAAAAMVDIGLADEVEQTMATLPAGDRWEIIKTLIPVYTAQMKDSDTQKARAGRDALFGVRGYAPPEEQKQIDAVLLPSIEKDLREGRIAGARHSLDKVIAALGPAAAPMLITLLEDPRVPFQGVADILERVGDEAARERGGVALIKRALATHDVPVALWRALGTMGGKPANAFLLEKVQKGFEKDAVAAAQALQQRRDPAVLPVALRIASDSKANRAVRDEMFGLVEKIGGLEAQRGLLHIIATDPTELVRYRAYEAVLAVGKQDAVVAALEAFPASASFKKDDVVDFLVKDITKIGAPAKAAVLKALASSNALARMTAVLALEAPLTSDARASLGSAADAPAVLKLSGDRGSVRGFPAGNTVGKEATRVAGILQKRTGS
jgi:hypothetical protein